MDPLDSGQNLEKVLLFHIWLFALFLIVSKLRINSQFLFIIYSLVEKILLKMIDVLFYFVGGKNDMQDQ